MANSRHAVQEKTTSLWSNWTIQPCPTLSRSQKAGDRLGIRAWI